MNLTSPKTIKELLAKHQAKPSKFMGQNFLIDNLVLDKIVKAGEVNLTDTILEIGPGLGTLTQVLTKHAKKVIAIEKDHTMIKILQQTINSFKNTEIIQADILQTTNYSLPTTHYKLIANLPYYITSPIIRMFLEAKNQPECLVLMVQKEVAQRICATPPNMSILAVSVQFYGTAKIIATVSKSRFWPAPKVDSAIIKITPFKNSPKVNAQDFFAVVKAGFSHPRKQLGNNLSTALKKDRQKINDWLLINNLNPTQRAETLTIQDWVNLVNSSE